MKRKIALVRVTGVPCFDIDFVTTQGIFSRMILCKPLMAYSNLVTQKNHLEALIFVEIRPQKWCQAFLAAQVPIFHVAY